MPEWKFSFSYSKLFPQIPDQKVCRQFPQQQGTFQNNVLVCNRRSWKMHWKMHNGLSFCIVIISKWAIYDSTWTKSPNHICVFDLRKDVRTESFWGDGIQLVGKSLTPAYKTNKLEVSMGFHNKLPGFLSLSSFKWKHFLL